MSTPENNPTPSRYADVNRVPALLVMLAVGILVAFAGALLLTADGLSADLDASTQGTVTSSYGGARGGCTTRATYEVDDHTYEVRTDPSYSPMRCPREIGSKIEVRYNSVQPAVASINPREGAFGVVLILAGCAVGGFGGGGLLGVYRREQRR